MSPYRIDIHPSLGYVRLVHFPSVVKACAVEIRRELVKALDATAKRRALIDLTQTRWTPSECGTFLVEHAMPRGTLPRSRIAMVVNADQVWQAHTDRSHAQRHGIVLEIFTNLRDAEAWLSWNR